jgi:hypothetical protein
MPLHHLCSTSKAIAIDVSNLRVLNEEVVVWFEGEFQRLAIVGQSECYVEWGIRVDPLRRCVD